MPNRLAELRRRAGLTQGALAALVHSGRSTIAKLESGERPLNDRWLERLSRHLGCTPSDILGDMVQLVGHVGAGGSIVYEDAGYLGMVKRPPETAGELVGLEVHGDSMLPKFDPGDIVFISREWDIVDSDDIGSYCVVRLVTGETYLKILERGAQPGFYTLRSLNAAPMENVPVLWAAPIRAITPKAARRFG